MLRRIARITVALTAALGSAAGALDGVSEQIGPNVSVIELSSLSGSFRLELLAPGRIITASGAESNLTGRKYQFSEDGSFFIDNNVRDFTACGVDIAAPFCNFTEYKLQGLSTKLYAKQQLLRLDGGLVRGSFRTAIPAPVPRFEDIIDLGGLFEFFALVEGPTPVAWRLSFGGTAVPEPSTWGLLLTGFAAAGATLRRARAARA